MLIPMHAAIQRVRERAFRFGPPILLLVLFCATLLCQAADVQLSEQAPVSVVKLPSGVYLVDFGRVAFGNLLLTSEPESSSTVTVRFGESLRGGEIDRTPPGSVRFAEVTVHLDGSAQLVAPAPDARNTTPPAVLTPSAWGVLLPFRWAEIQGWPGELRAENVKRRAAFDSTWDEHAASFHSSDPMLDRIWDLCHYSIGATTFAGVFVDGDRERVAYEADAYLAQLSYYAGDPSSQLERDTFERLMQYPTWPTEWAPHMVFMAYADWMQTGDKAWAAKHYEFLKSKVLEERVETDGLVHSSPAQIRRGDIVDWPTGERDGYVFTAVNTVVNAFHLRALEDMRRLASALGKNEEAAHFAEEERASLAAFQKALFDKQTGLYRDGAGTDHESLHANLFPLAFGLVPENKRSHVAQWLAGRGMRGSVYIAQYLLEGLFENGQATAALAEMTAEGDRSWRHMVDSGATITWEAWDQRYKPNQDWNHAWGAAPANLLPRFVLGVQAGTPGWTEAHIQPHPGDLQFAEGTVPTPKGPIHVAWKTGAYFAMQVKLPPGMTAWVRLPATGVSQKLVKDGKPVAAHREGPWWALDGEIRGDVSLQIR